MKVITVLVLLDCFRPGHEHCHWVILALIRVRVTKFDVNYDINLTIP